LVGDHSPSTFPKASSKGNVTTEPVQPVELFPRAGQDVWRWDLYQLLRLIASPGKKDISGDNKLGQ